MNFGLTDAEIAQLQALFRQQPELERVWLFGSRALGTHRPYSDIDLAVEGAALTWHDVAHLLSELDELPLPYAFDVVQVGTIQNTALREHIQRFGVLLFEKAIYQPESA